MVVSMLDSSETDPLFIMDRRLVSFKQKIGYNEAIKKEKRDGLIDIDFTKLKAPPFATQWPDERGWSVNEIDQMGGHHYFHSGMRGIYGNAFIEAKVFENYDSAQKEFFLTAGSASISELPWVACTKKIGTLCARDKRKLWVFFVYKNVIIEVERMGNEHGHDDFAEVLSEWLFEALKAAPRRPFVSNKR